MPHSHPLHKVMVKFREGVPAAEAAKRLVREFRQRFVTKARPLFPDDLEPELAALYELDVDKQATLPSLMEALRADVDIEYVHLPENRTSQHS